MIDGSGRPIYVRGTTQDITDRKLSEEAIAALSGRLITAQEEERSRIAREFHDDLSQRMALLHISLERASSVAGLSVQAHQDLAKMTEMTTEMSSDIDNWSHQLHPSKLELLGLVRSLQVLCREFTVQYKIEFQFLHRDVPGKLRKDVTLYLYRITQEALRNVVRHSEAAEAEVKLSGGVDEIELSISDSGQGFDVESAKEGSGLGIISMRERLRLIGGHLSIESEPSHGTRIRVRVPHNPAKDN